MLTTIDATRAAPEEPAPSAPASGMDEEKMAALQRLVDRRDQLDPERRAVVETLAQQYKIPMRPVTGMVAQPNPRKEQMSDFGQAAKVSALPMAGQLAGGAVGTMIGGIPGGIAGQSVGGMAGLTANKLLGVSNPDSIDAALTGAAPVAGKVLTMAGRRSIPGVEAAEQQIGAEAMRKVANTLPGSKAATTAAYDAVEKLGNPTMPVNHFQKAVSDLFTTEKTAKLYGGANPQMRRSLMDAHDTLIKQNGQMPFRDVATMLKRYRQKVDSLESTGGEMWGGYKELRGALFKDMEAAEQAGGQSAASVQAQRAAMSAAKQQIAKDELSEMIGKYGTKMVTVNGRTFEVIEPTKVLNKLKDLDFAATAGPQAKKVEATLKQLSAIPKVDMNTGTGVGTAGRAWAMAGAAAAGGALGSSMTAGLGGAAAAYGAIQLHDAVASLAMSDRGRNFLVKIFKANQGRMGERTAQMLQFAATQLEDTPEQSGQKTASGQMYGPPNMQPEAMALQEPDVTPGDLGNVARYATAKGLGLAGGAMLGMFKVTSPHHGTYYASDRAEAERIVSDMRKNSPTSDGSDRRIRPRIIDLEDKAYQAKNEARLRKKYGDEFYDKHFGGKP